MRHFLYREAQVSPTGHYKSIEKLFQFRQVFHRIARREARDRTAMIVSWVDVILAKLGETIPYVVGYSATGNASELAAHESGRVLIAYREESALRAALQLPGRHLISHSMLNN